MIKRCVRGDGNCFPRAVALWLFGRDDLYPFARLIMVLEMINHADYYQHKFSAVSLVIHFSNNVRDTRIMCSHTLSVFSIMWFIYHQ